MTNLNQMMVKDKDEVLFNVKVILAGDGCVGKSSLLRRYVFDEFTEAHAIFVTLALIASG